MKGIPVKINLFSSQRLGNFNLKCLKSAQAKTNERIGCTIAFLSAKFTQCDTSQRDEPKLSNKGELLSVVIFKMQNQIF